MIKTKLINPIPMTNGAYLINDVNEIKEVLIYTEQLEKVSDQIDKSIEKNNQGFAMTIRKKVNLLIPESINEYKLIMKNIEHKDIEKEVIMLVLYGRLQGQVTLDLIMFSQPNEKKREEAYLEMFDEILDYSNEKTGEIDIL